ncbi:hypothetical protein N7517_008855 [Penicillium concentricum]|uniref:N-acetyltransferase domain-containing protein n=1 Tax=Penicillium concentricum TaxID=293559 RepID=A0A9W9RVE4_9EURO|nr:uncharacterized protein N7517_008855 [Penicillium concentricum]KAJ5365969.1 hypothetical protein N7517_008855 [Penicillium concentricum]
MATQVFRELSKSSRLIYRAPESSEEDVAFFHHHIVNDDVIKTLGGRRLPRPYPKKSAEEFIKAMQDSVLGVVICLPQDSPEADQNSKPVPIGFVGVFGSTGPDHAHHRNAMIVISLADGFRGKGYGGEAINWALDWAFQHVGLHRVTIGAFSFNHDALKLYRKLGFVDEGREREAVYHRRAWHDIVNLSMLEHEWEVLRGIVPDQTDRTPASLPETSGE